MTHFEHIRDLDLEGYGTSHYPSESYLGTTMNKDFKMKVEQSKFKNGMDSFDNLLSKPLVSTSSPAKTLQRTDHDTRRGSGCHARVASPERHETCFDAGHRATRHTRQ